MIQSPFNILQQEQSIESRIVVALERISEAFRVLLWQESKENSLSPIQIQLLIFLLFHSQERCRVSNLAAEFNMTKATISDSIRVLLQKGLIEKITDETDTRSFWIVLTEKGRAIAQKSATFTASIEQPLHQFSVVQKEILLTSLLELIEKLNKAGIITAQRMCLSCRFYKKDSHFCGLMERPLAPMELKVDCPEHQRVQ
ncbi:MAG TPA: MarR family winged helix-turn-helix transcriptional regulator [Patescibacteria group bacterium]|nr:MarR family winged helix-turn-helix transcriptional regulator [Patescibacteria group bacterium]